MLGWRPLALGMASSLFFVAAADAQQAPRQTRRHHRAAAGDGPGRSASTCAAGSLGIALQQKLSAAAKAPRRRC